MLKVDTSVVQKQLADYKLEVERKLKYMVAGFAKEVAIAASNATPVGSADALYNIESYREYYEIRKRNYGIEMRVGFHAGAWVYSELPTSEFDASIYSRSNVADGVSEKAKASYKLGDTFYIMATGPGYSLLNDGYSAKAPDGIVAPTMQAITAMYSVQLVDYYRKG